MGIGNARIDYMGDEDPELVEMNLMSAGLNGMSDQLQQLTSILKNHRSKQVAHYPKNQNQFVLGEAIEMALKESYGKEGYILMLVHWP